MIERHPNGTDAIPHPHTTIHWPSGPTPTITVELDPHEYSNGLTPKIEGFVSFFVGFHGYDKPTHLAYKPISEVALYDRQQDTLDEEGLPRNEGE